MNTLVSKMCYLAVISLVSLNSMYSQSAQDQKQFKKIFDTALSESQSYDWLNHLSNQIGGRLSGSVQAAQAVSYTEALLKDLQIPKVWKQDVMVPKWVRGTPEFAYIELSPGVTTDVPILALGGSVVSPGS